MNNEPIPVLSEDKRPMPSPTQVAEKASTEPMCEDTTAQNAQEAASDESAEDAQKDENMSRQAAEISAAAKRIERPLHPGISTPDEFMSFSSRRDAERQRAWALFQERNHFIPNRERDKDKVKNEDKVRGKFQGDDDSEIDEMDESAMTAAAERLNALDRAMGSEVKIQSGSMQATYAKTDLLDPQIVLKGVSRAILDRIH